MDSQGMLPKHCCKNCGKPLNADGGHPAELYAGTYTGLCYSCERGPAFVYKIDPLDNVQHWDFPPHCPAWRRDREYFIGYAGCPKCSGTGAIMISRPDGQGGNYRKQCEICSDKYYTHPLRQRRQSRVDRIRSATKRAVISFLINRGYAQRKATKKAGYHKLLDHKSRPVYVTISDYRIGLYVDIFYHRGGVLLKKLEIT